MHFVAGNGETRARVRAGDLAKGLGTAHDRVHVQKPQPRRLARWPFDALRVTDHATKHLVAGADADHPPTPSQVRRNVGVPSLRAKEGQVGKRRLGAGQDHHIGIAGNSLAGLHPGQCHIRLGGEGVEIVEVGNARQPEYSNLHRPAAAARPAVGPGAWRPPQGAHGHRRTME